MEDIEFNDNDNYTQFDGKNNTSPNIDKSNLIKKESSIELAETINEDCVFPTANDTVYYGNNKNNLNKIQLGEVISEGGEGTIYDIQDWGGKYAKIYKQECLNPQRVKKLERMVEIQHERGFTQSKNICWPDRIIYDHTEKQIIGFSMPVASFDSRKGRPILFGDLDNIIHKLQSSSSNVIDEYEWTRQNLFQVCGNIADLFQELHRNSSILMGDVNPRNILVDHNFKVYFIDTDSFQVENFPCPVGMDEYISPNLYEQADLNDIKDFSKLKRTLEDEEFAASVLYFYILFLGELPFEINSLHSVKDSILYGGYRFRLNNDNKDFTVPTTNAQKRSCIWQNLSLEIKEMFENTFVKHKIYSDHEWGNAFRNMVLYISRDNPPIYSNELTPHDAILDPKHEKWEYRNCSLCGKPFLMVPHKTLGEIEQDECICFPCKENMMINSLYVQQAQCSVCGKLWTINNWDARDLDPETVKCPDCGGPRTFEKIKYYKYNVFKQLKQEDLEKMGYFAIQNYNGDLI